MVFLLISLVGITAVLTVALEAERISGAIQSKSVRLNAICGLCQMIFARLVCDVIAPTTVWLTGKVGNPPIHLSGRGWMFPVSLLTTLALVDLVDYAFHRLEHRVPWLWAMHSLHHSDSEMNATTAYRHFWLDRALQAIAFIPLWLLVHPDFGVMLGVIVAGWVLAAFEHSNIRVGHSWLIVTPQFHRVHHSILQEHYDRNFAGFLPLWDVLFGTYLEPDGFPETGLTEGEPHSVKDALLWAFSDRSGAPRSQYSGTPSQSPSV